VGEKAYQKLQLILNESIKRSHSFKINRLKFYFFIKNLGKIQQNQYFHIAAGGHWFLAEIQQNRSFNCNKLCVRNNKNGIITSL